MMVVLRIERLASCIEESLQEVSDRTNKTLILILRKLRYKIVDTSHGVI